MVRGGSTDCEILPNDKPVLPTLPSDAVQVFSLPKKLPYPCPPHQPQAQQLLPHLGPHSSTQLGKYLQAMSSLETSISSDLSLYGQDWHIVGAQYLQDQ